jgi:hypothetical protein
LLFLVCLVLLIDLRDCLDTCREVASTNFSIDLIKVSVKSRINFEKRVSILEVVIDTFKNVETVFEDSLSFKDSEKTIDSYKQKKEKLNNSNIFSKK